MRYVEYKCKCGTELIMNAEQVHVADEDNVGGTVPMIRVTCPKCMKHFDAAYNPKACSVEDATKMAYDMYIAGISQTPSQTL